VITGVNIGKIYGIKRMEIPYSGYVGLITKKNDGHQSIYLNNLNLYPALWSYEDSYFLDFENETTGNWSGLLDKRFHLENYNSLFDGGFSEFYDGFDVHVSGNILYLSETDQFNTGEFLNG
jgi:hypothetical protein